MKYAAMLVACIVCAIFMSSPSTAGDGYSGVAVQSFAPAVVLQSVHAQPQVVVQQVRPVRVQQVVVQQVPQYQVQQFAVQQVQQVQHAQRVQQVVVQRAPHVQRVQQVVVQQVQHPSVVVQRVRNQPAQITRQVTVSRPQRLRFIGR